MFPQKSSNDYINQISDIDEIGGLKGHCAIVINEFQSSTYLTYHEIDENNKIKDGRFIDIDEAVKGLKTLNDAPIDDESHWIDPNLLYSNESLLIWQSKAQQRTLWFLTGQRIKIQAHTPSLIFVLDRKNRKLGVFCHKSKSRPTPDTKLYNAPLMNISLDGNLCLGNAPLPSYLNSDSPKLRQQCEAVLFESNFSHVNNNSTFKQKKPVTSQAHIAFWKKLEKENRAPKACELVESKMTLNKIIKGL